MKASLALGLSALLSSASAQYYRGFNVGASLSSGACRSTEDWTSAFNAIKSFPGDFTSARLYAASDCNTLANAVPAAINTGMTLLVGVWTEDNTHYEAEKQGLLAAIQQYGSDWILAVSVGSEDLYRGDTDASTLASQINDVRGMLWGLGAGSVQVGHVVSTSSALLHGLVLGGWPPL
jgi:exo-beta-1,3-glucanase (GH17 family)